MKKTAKPIYAFILLIIFVTPVSTKAHVKWFSSEANSHAEPLSLIQVLSSTTFIYLVLLFFGMMLIVAWADHILSHSNSQFSKKSDHLDSWVTPLLPRALRYSLALFLVASIIYHGTEPVYLTPELKASGQWVLWLQAVMAISLIWKRSAWVAALGIVLLYGCATVQYGWFHLLDYPVFLAVSAFLAMDSLSNERHIGLSWCILRLGAGITLMWAGGEKWLYPWWSYPMLDAELSAIQFGLSHQSFMFLAAFVEFCAAYALVFGRRTSQLAAIVLLIPFLAAIPVFGMLDAIGHSPIIAVLAMLALTNNRLPEPFLESKGWHGRFHYAGLCSLGTLFTLGLYWLLQYVAYPVPLAEHRSVEPTLATLLMLPAVVYLLPKIPAFRIIHKASPPNY
ncbi:DoxX family membrane protein [Halomonas elongata]|uniref:DoxX family membrane protein n=1 Tax=Halomonas elongata TaxID=2746 RepID=UPI0038D463FA